MRSGNRDRGREWERYREKKKETADWRKRE